MALSKPLKEKESAISFGTPSEDFDCPVCLSILREPFLTTCCGSHFCERCVEGVKKKDNLCPICRSKPLVAVIDKYFKRRLQVKCPDCMKIFQRCDITEHLALCTERELPCTFSEVGCKMKVRRRLLQKHLATDIIQHQTLMCEGLSKQAKELSMLKAELLETKEKSCGKYWLNGFKLLSEEIKKNNWPFYLTTVSKFVNSMSCLVSPVVLHIKCTVRSPQSTFLENGGIEASSHLCTKGHYSVSFYTHAGGYKMALHVKIVCHCRDCRATYNASGEMPNVDSILVQLCTVEGEYDDKLHWPYKGMATIELLNKIKDINHLVKDYTFTAERCQAAVDIPPTKKPKLADVYNFKLVKSKKYVMFPCNSKKYNDDVEMCFRVTFRC